VDLRTHELRELHKKLLNASETERRRLARELHDSVAQDLIVLQLLLKQYSPEAKNFQQQQATVQNLTNKLITDIRRICQGLYPPVLESLGLYQALKSLEEYHQVTGMDVEVQWEAESRPPRLKQDLEIGLFRIAQEALSNAFKHGKAKKSIVELYSSGDGSKLTMTITDNGSGEVDPEKVKSGFGLQTMRDRASAMGGTFAFLPVPHGTCVCVEIPLIESEENDSFQ
jgi:two-component system sensor histidine kinase UhpB